MISVESGESEPRTIWSEFETWAEPFQPWQRYALCQAIREGVLSDHQIEDTYGQFLFDHGLGPAPSPPLEIPAAIAGRPATALQQVSKLKALTNLRGVNALSADAALTFSPGLTVIYGGNGVGKSGFARILSSGCFCRNRPTIHPNIYAEGAPPTLGATVTITNAAGIDTEIELVSGADIPELKRISVFDTSEARTYLTEQNPLGYKPVGFDVFPEMARVYGALTRKLSDEIGRRKSENPFPASFLAPESSVSRLVAELGAATDKRELEQLAVFGEAETLRLADLGQKILQLQSQTAEAAIAQLIAAKADVLGLRDRLVAGEAAFSREKRTAYGSLIANMRETLAAVAAAGADSFKRSFFKAVGSPEWEQFLQGARGLALKEGPDYPTPEDHCLLCHRPLDPGSNALIRRFWAFLESDLQQQAAATKAQLDDAVSVLKGFSWEYFGADTTARASMMRLRPALVDRIDATIAATSATCSNWIEMLEQGGDDFVQPASVEVFPELLGVLQQLDADLAELRAGNVAALVAPLEQERVLLRHRQLLQQLFPAIVKYLADQAWAATADLSRRALNPRHITEKEGELFGTIIADGYRTRLSEECQALDCDLPVEMHAQGQRGQTVRSLRILGRYKPDQILSEGEQRSVALADFLTEVSLNPAASGIILDDPVNSQDHRRKDRIAARLVFEAKRRQVVIFTHDMVFLTRLIEFADEDCNLVTHWVERDSQGNPGQVALGDSPAGSPAYRKTGKAEATLSEARAATGSQRHQLIQRGMGELRRTIEEVIPHFLFQEVVRRWNDRVIVTALRKVNWDAQLVEQIVVTYEELSRHIEGHSHPEGSIGAPPEPETLAAMITRVGAIIVGLRRGRA